jgi:ATP-binding cassette subfamily C protein CydCD
VSASPPRPGRPRLVDPELAARVPGLRRVAGIALGVGALSAVIVVVQAVALAHVVDRSLLHHTPLGALAPAIVIVGLAIVARAALHVAGDHSAHGAADRVVSTLRGELLRHALALGPGWLAGERPGELSVTATRGLRSLHSYYARYLPQAAAAAVIPVILLAWVATQDWLSFAVVVALVIAVPITMIGFGRESTRRSERQWRRLGSLAGRFLQLIEGLPTLRAFGREHHGRREVAAATEGVRAATMRTLRVAFLSALSMDMIAGFGVGFVAMVLGLRLLWGELGLQTAMAVLLVAPEIFIPLRRAGAEFHASTEGQAASARVVEVLATGVPAGTFAAGSGAATARPAPRQDGRGAALTVDWLRVDYEHRDHPAVASFSLHVPPGTRLALTGPSGCGKSTVLAALLRFVEPAAGTIALDGRPSGAIDAGAWRSYFSWLPQRPHLFNATLAENLRLGARDAPDADLQSVLAAVGLYELLANLPAGLGTALGHDGLTLSSGERQRVALARALLCPAPILLLDEPTASLDPPTVARLAPAVEPWLEGRTVIVAAHEPVLLPRFDAIVAVPATAGLPLVVSP